MESPYLGIRRNKLIKSVQEYNKKEITFDLSIVNSIKQNGLKLPKELTLELAEEVGIHIGDGHLSKDRYRYKLFGNINESDYYMYFIPKLYKTLFNINVKIITRSDNTIGFEFCSKSLWLFKTKILVLPFGRKDNISVPEMIFYSDFEIQKSFIRGLFDTDGNVYFQSRYGYKDYYPVITLDLKPQQLAKDVKKILTNLGFKAVLYESKRGYFIVKLYGYENILKYAKEIGWHNKKHIIKFLDWKENYSNIINRAAAEI